MPPLGERSSRQWYNNHTSTAISGTLFVVSTPIGNLEDVTLRALRVLREADLIAAEDTRRTARLLARHAISTPSLSFHQHNVRTRIPQLLTRLRSGAHIALVSDAGTPGISDPGTELVHACIEAGIPVDPIPGASAPIAATVASGFPLIPLTILGFPPRKAKDRTCWWSYVCGLSNTFTFFESPLRISATLREASGYLGERHIVVAREVTKLHQEFIRGTLSSVLDRLQNIKGEITVVVGPASEQTVSYDQSTGPPSDTALAEYFGRLIESGASSRRAAVAETAKRFGVAGRVVYGAVEKSKKLGVRPNNAR